MKFSIGNYFRPTPTKIQKLMVAIKASLVAFAGTTYVTGHPAICAGILLFTGVINEIGAFFIDESDETPTPQ